MLSPAASSSAAMSAAISAPAAPPPCLPILALAVAQPKHVGRGVGRVGHDVGDRGLLALVKRGAGDLVAETLGALEQGADDLGDGTASLHASAKSGWVAIQLSTVRGRRRRSWPKPRWWRRAGNRYGRVRNTRVCRASVVRGWPSVDPLRVSVDRDRPQHCSGTSSAFLDDGLFVHRKGRTFLAHRSWMSRCSHCMQFASELLACRRAQ